MSDSFVVSGTLFNKEYEVTIQKEWGVMVLRDSRIVRQFSETIGKINSLDIINIINLEDEYKNYMCGFELKLTKREFEQKLREIKLNNLLK